MLPLEIVLPIILTVYLIWSLVTGQRRRWVVNRLPLLALLGIGLHLVLEKYRRQMVPLL
jgi:hypothetical protein